MSEFIVEARALSRRYKNGSRELEVLKEIAFKIRKGEFVAIQGPSGAGKSTLLHILGGLDEPTEGSVLFDGEDLYRISENERASLRNRKIGFVFQFYHLLPELSALENVMVPALFTSWWQRRASKKDAALLMEKVGLGGRMHHTPAQLSGGEQQRVAIARALMNNPEALLCDEPTGNLDSENGAHILEIVRRLNADDHATVVMVTHDRDIAKAAGRVVYLKDGIIVEPARAKAMGN